MEEGVFLNRFIEYFYGIKVDKVIYNDKYYSKVTDTSNKKKPYTSDEVQ